MKFLLKTVLCVLVTMVSACSSEEFIEEQAGDKQVIITAADFKYEDGSRTSIDMGPSGGMFTWAENDTIGIFPNEGAQAYFPITTGVGTNNASFNGGGWALKDSYTYTAYYPMQGKFYLDKTSIPVSYEGQIQTGDASTSHLGKYDFMAAPAVTPQGNKINFSFKHLGCLVKMVITLPKVEQINDVTLTVPGTSIITQGVIDLTASTPSLTKTSTSSSFKVKLDNVVTSSSNKTATVYFMMAPQDLRGKTIDVSVGQYKKSIEGVAFRAERLKELSVKFETSSLWVDLGLPSGIRWASRNVGANKPEESGRYFAWGEISEKESYSAFNNPTFGQQMESIQGNKKYDVVAANWDAPARMPTKEDFEELINHTKREWVTTPVPGIKVIGTNGNSIFFPAAGQKSGSVVQHSETKGTYWSASPANDINNYKACCLDLGNGMFGEFFDLKDEQRYIGMCVRPVLD